MEEQVNEERLVGVGHSDRFTETHCGRKEVFMISDGEHLIGAELDHD